MDGQTPGKRLHRIRVVREGGYSVTFGVSAVRNLLRIIDMQPVFFYLVGMASVLLTKRGRRLGDLVAGTIVVREDVRRSRLASPLGRAPPTPGTQALHTQLSEDEYTVLSRFVERWPTLEPQRRAALAHQLARGSAPHSATTADRRLRACSSCYERERRARAARRRVARRDGRGARAPGAHRRGQPALDRRSRRSCTLAQKNGLRSLGENGVREFVAEYRALSADLARLRTAAGGRAVDELFYLGRLVAGAHNLLYRDRGMPLRGGRALPLHRRPARGAPLGRADRARRAPALRAGGDRRRRRGATSRRSRRSSCRRDDPARRGRRAPRAHRRGLHRRPAALSPGHGEPDHRQQRAGDLRRLRGRRHGRALVDPACSCSTACRSGA